MTWSVYARDLALNTKNSHKFTLILDSYPLNFPSFKTNTYELENALMNLMKISNIDQTHPFQLCTLRN